MDRGIPAAWVVFDTLSELEARGQARRIVDEAVSRLRAAGVAAESAKTSYDTHPRPSCWSTDDSG